MKVMNVCASILTIKLVLDFSFLNANFWLDLYYAHIQMLDAVNAVN